ncbi:MAG: hypothetical protein DME17_13960 [Candidatus Rokuibacteriota bacterium]|nr:MAG: hypothetical protein DME17_13960 [Candidatus Rokubacteria bacterium]
MRVLVVEDDRTIASFVVAGLRQAGFAVDHAVNAEAALELTQTEPHDAAIVDIMLPGMDWLTLVEAMRRDKILTPVLILSAKRSVDDRVKGLQPLWAGGRRHRDRRCGDCPRHRAPRAVREHPRAGASSTCRIWSRRGDSPAAFRPEGARSPQRPDSRRCRFGGLPFDLPMETKRRAHRRDQCGRQCKRSPRFYGSMTKLKRL